MHDIIMMMFFSLDCLFDERNFSFHIQIDAVDEAHNGKMATILRAKQN